MALKKLRNEVGKKRNESLKSTACIKLPFQVVANKMEKFVIPFKSNDANRSQCMVLHVRMFAVEDDYDDNKEAKRPKLFSVQSNN